MAARLTRKLGVTPDGTFVKGWGVRCDSPEEENAAARLGNDPAAPMRKREASELAQVVEREIKKRGRRAG